MSGFVDLLTDPDRGETATYRPQEIGTQVALRVVSAEPAKDEDAVLVVATATLPSIAAGDTFDLGGDVLTVLAVKQDASGTAWRVVCAR
jgi:hypothetical protein